MLDLNIKVALGRRELQRRVKFMRTGQTVFNKLLWLMYLGMIWMIDQVLFSFLKVDVGLLQAVEYQAYLKII